jgi:bilirubin oxidase
MSFAAELPNGIYGATQPGMGAGQQIPNYTQNPLNGSNFKILDIQVVAPTANPVSAISPQLVTHTPWQAAQADTTRTLTFTPVNMGPTAIQGPFVINMMPFDMMMINYYIPFENTEIWTLVNQSPISHPFHIHNVHFYVLDINGVPPPAHLAGRKDVIHVPSGNGTVRFITKFEDFHNDVFPYMYHCHMLTHEDDGFMGQFIVKSPEISTGELRKDEVWVYPNPSSKFININGLLEAENTHFTLTDILGKKVLEGEINATDNRILIENLTAGMYFLQIDNHPQYFKILKN